MQSPKTEQVETENMNRTITMNEIESVIKKHLANRSPGLDDFIGEFYQTYIVEVIHTFLKLFQKTEEITYAKLTASGKLLYNTGNSTWYSVTA